MTEQQPMTEGEMGAYCREKFQEFMKDKPLDVLPKFNDLHTLVLIQACIDILHKTRSLSVADVELKNAFEQLCLAKEKIECQKL